MFKTPDGMTPQAPPGGPHVGGPEQLYLRGIELSRLTFSIWGVALGLRVGTGARPLPPQNVKFSINIM